MQKEKAVGSSEQHLGVHIQDSTSEYCALWFEGAGSNLECGVQVVHSCKRTHMKPTQDATRLLSCKRTLLEGPYPDPRKDPKNGTLIIPSFP